MPDKKTSSSKPTAKSAARPAAEKAHASQPRRDRPETPAKASNGAARANGKPASAKASSKPAPAKTVKTAKPAAKPAKSAAKASPPKSAAKQPVKAAAKEKAVPKTAPKPAEKPVAKPQAKAPEVKAKVTKPAAPAKPEPQPKVSPKASAPANVAKPVAPANPEAPKTTQEEAPKPKPETAAPATTQAATAKPAPKAVAASTVVESPRQTIAAPQPIKPAPPQPAKPAPKPLAKPVAAPSPAEETIELKPVPAFKGAAPASGVKNPVLVGAVAGAFGVKGEVRIRSFTVKADGVVAYGPLYDSDGKIVLRPKSWRETNDGVIISAPEIKTREEAEALKGQRVYIPRAHLPEPKDEDEFYIVDLLGCAAETVDGATLGEVVAVWNFGAGDIIEFKPPQGQNVRVSFTKEIVPLVDLAHRRVVIDPPAPEPVN